MKLCSSIVVISWWSNSLGLACLHRLVKHAPGRGIQVVQRGKRDAALRAFREHLPSEVTELELPEHCSHEHGDVLEALVRGPLARREGIWFFDHDTMLNSRATDWLALMDQRFGDDNVSLCTPRAPSSGSLTSPAFWIAPQRLPPGTPSFAPARRRSTAAAARPDLYRRGLRPVLATKDTLAEAWGWLAARGLASCFDTSGASAGAARFPRHTHIGGLHCLAGPPFEENDWDPDYVDWLVRSVSALRGFFDRCPGHWRSIEDRTLLERLLEYERALDLAAS